MCMDVSSLTRILRNLPVFIPTKKHASSFPDSYLPVTPQCRVGGAWRSSPHLYRNFGQLDLVLVATVGVTS